MLFSKNRLRIFFAALALILTTKTASAGVIIDVAQSGSNVVATISGSLGNLGTPLFSTSLNELNNAGLRVAHDDNGNNPPRRDKFIANLAGNYTISVYPWVSGPTVAWGNTPVNNTANGATVLNGIKMFTFIGGSQLNLNADYVFGTPITGTATFSNKTLAQMGLTNLGTYTSTFGSGINTDTVTFNIGSSGGGGAAVPEPSSLALVSIGAVAAAIRARRKAKAKA
jgi:hypothetical protein